MDAYLTGLEQAHAKGVDLSTIRSVASFFVSRVDTEVDKRLDAIGTDEAKALRSKAAVANARLAYQAYEEVFSTDRWTALEAAGAHKQRPLWASTSVKDPDLPDTMYVVELVAPDTVNTMPEATIEATADHGEIAGDTVTSNYDDAQDVLARLEKLGISYDEVVQVIEDEGVDKFEKSWQELLDTVQKALDRRRRRGSREDSADRRYLHHARRTARHPWSRTASRAGSLRRTPRSGDQKPRPRLRSGCPGSIFPRPPGRCWPRSTRCVPSCGPRGSTRSCCAAWAGRRWPRR